MYLIIRLWFYIYALMMFSNSLRMIRTDGNMSELWQIVGKKYSLNISAFIGFIVWTV